MVSLEELAGFLDRFLLAEQVKQEFSGIYRPSLRSISRLGVALEPWEGLTSWAIAEHLDALFLHRPWKLEIEQLPSDVSVLSYHLAFDERLTLGFNPDLAAKLGIGDLEIFGEKAGRPIGMVGQTERQSFKDYCDRVEAAFEGLEAVHLGKSDSIARVAVVGAMTDVLIREAVARGAEVYITGQFRQPAKQAVLEMGIAVIVVGHRRSEVWGLNRLAEVVRDRWPGLQVVLPPQMD